MASASASEALTIASLCSAFSVQCGGAVCAAGRAQPQYESRNERAAPTEHYYASLTMLITLLALASASQAASRSHPKVEQVDTEDVPPRVQRTSTLPRNQAECAKLTALPAQKR